MLTKEETEKRINGMYNEEDGMIDHDLHLNWNAKQLKELRIFYMKGACFIDINFSGKVVADYGCGGGWLGKYLLDKYPIKKYIGLDVAERSVAFAKNNLPKSNTQIIKIDPWDQLKSLQRKRIDILISVACMQHFPTKEYLDSWLEQVNNLDLEWVVIQFHYSTKTGGTTVFRDDPYGSIRDVAYACYTTLEYISKRLTNYKLAGHKEDIGKLERNFGYWKHV